MFIENLLHIRRLFRLILIMPLLFSCSHHYNSDLLDLTFYQWNLWPDEEAEWSELSQGITGNISVKSSEKPHLHGN